MASQSNVWVVLREGSRKLCCRELSHAEAIVLVACLSSDPRCVDELRLAWSRYRPEQDLMHRPWMPLAEIAGAPAAQQEWLWIDFTQQCFTWFGKRNQPLDHGGYAIQENPPPVRYPDSMKRTKGQRQRDLERGIHRQATAPRIKPNVWLNIPPWWKHLQVTRFPGALGQLLPTDDCLTSKEPLDFRRVLFGRPLAEFIARRVKDEWQSASSTHTATEGGGPTLDAQASDGPPPTSSGLSTAYRSERITIKQIHRDWLMTPCAQLSGRTPRELLHEHREWKDRELNYRRNQWSMTRRAPPAVPVDCHLFQYGPMGTEEVVLYYDMCRETITMACRWMEDSPQMELEQFIVDIERFIDGWLTTELPDGDGASAREIVSLERELMPRLASNEPLNCKCPLCRLQSQNTELFGPAFMICDGFHLEVEDEFAFSLMANRKDWEDSRDSWTDDDDDEDGWIGGQSPFPGMMSMVVSRGQPQGGMTSSLPPSSRVSDGEIWKSSYINPDLRSPQLSLLAIGTRLAELISELQEITAPPELIDGLNCAFDELGQAVRHWLVQPTSSPVSALSLDQVVEHMISKLERVTIDYPVLTAQSADLQSLVHDWQRQLAS